MPWLTIIGDVNVEVIGKLDFPFQVIDENRLVYSKLDMKAGGTTWKFATAAHDLFDPICVLGSVGADYLGTWAEQSLNNAGIETRLRRDPDLPTGLAISLWDGTDDGRIRLLMVRSENANQALDVSHVDNNADFLARADFVLTDGYCLLREPRRGATLHAMRRAVETGAQVVVDIVPHDCYQVIGHAEIRGWLEYATTAVVEVTTIRRLLQLDTPDKLADLPLALHTMERLSAEFPRHSFLLRFGAQNCEESLVCRPGREPVHGFTGAVGAVHPHNVADQATARELRTYFAEPG